MLVKAIEHGKITFAGNAEDRGHTLRDQGLNKGVPGRP